MKLLYEINIPDEIKKEILKTAEEINYIALHNFANSEVRGYDSKEEKNKALSTTIIEDIIRIVIDSKNELEAGTNLSETDYLSPYCKPHMVED